MYDGDELEELKRELRKELRQESQLMSWEGWIILTKLFAICIVFTTLLYVIVDYLAGPPLCDPKTSVEAPVAITTTFFSDQ